MQSIRSVIRVDGNQSCLQTTVGASRGTLCLLATRGKPIVKKMFSNSEWEFISLLHTNFIKINKCLHNKIWRDVIILFIHVSLFEVMSHNYILWVEWVYFYFVAIWIDWFYCGYQHNKKIEIMTCRSWSEILLHLIQVLILTAVRLVIKIEQHSKEKKSVFLLQFML